MPQYKLPTITHEVDAGDWVDAYKGLTITFHLNAPIVDEGTIGQTKDPWDTTFYHAVARQIQCVTVPGRLVEGGQDAVVLLDSAKAVWDLERHPSFDPAIIAWALRQYSALRNEWLQGALKNSERASGTPSGS